jgi:hypothetical protein
VNDIIHITSERSHNKGLYPLFTYIAFRILRPEIYETSIVFMFYIKTTDNFLLDLRYEIFKLHSFRICSVSRQPFVDREPEQRKTAILAATSYAPLLECGYGRLVRVNFI